MYESKSINQTVYFY